MKKLILSAISIASLFIGCSATKQEIMLTNIETQEKKSSDELTLDYKRCPEFGKSYSVGEITETEYVKSVQIFLDKEGNERKTTIIDSYKEGKINIYSACVTEDNYIRLRVENEEHKLIDIGNIEFK